MIGAVLVIGALFCVAALLWAAAHYIGKRHPRVRRFTDWAGNAASMFAMGLTLYVGVALVVQASGIAPRNPNNASRTWLRLDSLTVRVDSLNVATQARLDSLESLILILRSRLP